MSSTKSQFTPALHLVSGNQPSEAELRKIVAEHMEGMGVDSLSVDELLSDPQYSFIKDMAVELWKQRRVEEEKVAAAEAARAELALQQKKKADADRLFAIMREKSGFKPLNSQQWQQVERKINAPDPEPTKPASQDVLHPEIPDAVLALKKSMKGQLPSFVFKSGGWAMALRGELICWIKPVQSELRSPSISKEMAAALLKREQDIQELLEANNQVIAAWGLDRKNPDHFATEKDLRFVWKELNDYPRIVALRNQVKVETAEEIVARQKAEQEQLSAETAEQKRREQLQNTIKDLLIKEGASIEAADKMAGRLVRKYGDLKDSIAILRAGAVNKMLSAGESKADQQIAKLYAKAAAMSDADLEAAVEEKRKEHSPKDTLSSAKNSVLQACAMQSQPTRQNKPEGGGKKKGKNNSHPSEEPSGRKGRRTRK